MLLRGLGILILPVVPVSLLQLLRESNHCLALRGSHGVLLFDVETILIQVNPACQQKSYTKKPSLEKS